MGRLRSGEILAALGAVVLLADLFALHWYSGPVRTGWHAIPTLRWFVVVSAALALGLTIAQIASPGPALPVTLDLIGMLVAGLTTILLAIRLITTGAPLRAGAYVGIAAAATTALGAYRAMRTEQGWTPGGARAIELVELSCGPR